MGEVTIDGMDLLGYGINIVPQLQRHAPKGGVAVLATVPDLVDCDAPGDRSNLNPDTGPPCARTTLAPRDLADLVPYDNNVVIARFRVR
jgi:hypothetical protein